MVSLTRTTVFAFSGFSFTRCEWHTSRRISSRERTEQAQTAGKDAKREDSLPRIQLRAAARSASRRRQSDPLPNSPAREYCNTREHSGPSEKTKKQRFEDKDAVNKKSAQRLLERVLSSAELTTTNQSHLGLPSQACSS